MIKPAFLSLSLALASSALLSPQVMAATDFTCPDSPNCVSSKATGDHKVAALFFADKNRQAIKAAILKVLNNWERMEVTSSENNVIRAVATSKWIGFKDDITLMINSNGTVDVKSASRTGYSDFGVNRERVETLRQKLGQ